MLEGSFAPFVPAILTERLVRGGVEVAGPDGWRTSGAVLVIDITGFTALTERLAERGPGGAEALAGILNASFGDVIDRIRAHGGDVVSFAGDAILAVWPTTPNTTAAAVIAAATSALESQRTLEARPPVQGVHVRARAGIAIGAIWVGVVGGVRDEWRWVVGGPPLGGAGAAASAASPGELVLTAAAASAGGLSGATVEDGSDHVVVTTIDRPALADRDSGDDGADAPAHPSEDLLAAFLPRELVSRVRAGQTGWLAEFRRLTVLFVGIRNLDTDAPGALNLAQTAFSSAQAIIDHYDGSLNQIVDDDKGLTLVAAWGLPDRTHEDDPARGTLAARAIVDALTDLGLTVGAGVTTGRAFTGIRGSAERCEYAMVGDVVNLAARLMQSSAGEVRCDTTTARAATARLAAARLAVSSLGALQLKGKAGGIEAFRVDAETAGESVRPAPRESGRRTMVGRTAEWATLTDRVERFAADGHGGVVVIEGEPGVGKSEIVAHLVAEPPASVRYHVGEADAIERSTAYYVWRRPLLELLDVDGTDRSAVEAAILASLADDPALLERAPLLDAILPIELTATPLIASLEADVRADAIRDLAIQLISTATNAGPRVIVLEDVHWADSSSWALLLAVARRVPGVLLVLSTRPMGTGAPPEFARSLAEPGAERIALGPLGAEAAETLVCHALGVNALPPGVGGFIEERAEGNPFFSEQLAYALRDAGHLIVTGETCRLAVGVTDLRDLDVPDSVHGVIAGRIDGLSPSEQLTLKVASVIGRLFRVGILSDVHPLDDARGSVIEELDRAAGLDLTRLETPDPDLAYLFTHVITQEVAYELLVYAQRRPLHRAVAEWYEAHVTDLEPLVPLLAHHWSRAGVTEKALHYLGRAGEQALQNYANAEALGFLGEALALDEADGRPTAASTRADWERWTGIALVKSARYREALPHFEACLELLGAPNPRGRIRRSLSIGRHLGLQAWRRIHHRQIRAAERDRALAISECHRYLSEVSYWRNDLFRMVHAMLASLNHAEPAGDSKEGVVAFASVAFLFGLVQLHPIARSYRRLTDAASARVGNADAAGYAAELEGVYSLVVADWAAAHRVAERGISIFREIGDRMRWHTCHAIIGFAYLHQGQFDLAEANVREAVTAIGPEGLLQNRLWSLAGVVATDLAQDRLDLEVVDQLAGLMGPVIHHSDEILLRGLVAKARARAGDSAAAMVNALAVPPLVDAFPPPSYHTMLGIEGAAEVLIDRWAAAPTDREARRLARHAITGFRRFALFNHAGRPRVALFDGRAHLIEGDVARARRAWERARSIATRMDMPYEHALADIELAASYPAGSAERIEAVEQALANLEPHGGHFDAARARALLVGPVAGVDAVSAVDADDAVDADAVDADAVSGDAVSAERAGTAAG
jgi:class 3 adenylate cyclase/tetratricopeptide (TPR) repeat protein